MPIFDSEYPVPVTGSVQVLNPTIEVTATLGGPVTASVSNFPVGFNSNITASITLPVTGNVYVDNFVTATFPSGFNSNITASITLPITGTVLVENPTVFPAGFNVEITASIPLTASISNLPATQSVSFPSTALLSASVTNFPADQVVHGRVEVTASVPLQVTASVANFPATQTVTGTVHIDNFVTSTFPTGFDVNVTASVPLQVTSTLANPLWVTGTIDVINDLTGTVQVTGNVLVDNFPIGFNVNVTASVTQSVTGSVFVLNPVTTSSISNFPAGFNVNITASVTLPVSATNPVTASISNFPVTQSVWFADHGVAITASVVLGVSSSNPVTASIANFPAGFQVNVTQSIPLVVTASAANRVAVGIFDATGADMDLFKDGDNLAIGADHGLAILAVADGAPRKYHFLKTDATNNWLWVTGSVTTAPATTEGENVNITGSSVWLSASIVGQPTVTATIVQTGFNANITASIVLPVSATNPVTASIANFPTGFNANITGSIPLALVQNSGGFFVKLTGSSATNADGEATAGTGYAETTNYNKVFNGTTWDRQRALGVGITQVTATAGSPVWITGTTTVNNTVAVSATNVVSATLVGQTVWLSSSVVGGSSSSYGWVTASGSATLLRASAANRKGITVYNSGSSAAYVYLGNDAWASTTKFTVIMGTGTYYEAPYGWTGQVSAIWLSNGGSGSVTEVF